MKSVARDFRKNENWVYFLSERFRGVSIFRPGQDYDSVLRAVRVLNAMLELENFGIDLNIRDC